MSISGIEELQEEFQTWGGQETGMWADQDLLRIRADLLEPW